MGEGIYGLIAKQCGCLERSLLCRHHAIAGCEKEINAEDTSLFLLIFPGITSVLKIHLAAESEPQQVLSVRMAL